MRLSWPSIWRTLSDWAAQAVDIESQELLHSLLIELYPEM
jgi:hypothetical protein